MSGFDRTSRNISLNGTVLSAICKRADEITDNNSSIDLNSIIANDEGKLVRRDGGNFGETCSNIQLSNGKILSCTAQRTDGSEVNIRIDLSNFIANILIVYHDKSRKMYQVSQK
jgi:hypothetical protein